MLNVLDKLATALNRRDEIPNQELALQIVESQDQGAVAELVKNLSNKNRNTQSDCIKVLYEIGERDPDLVAPYYLEFGKLLSSRNNRLVWGAMTALDSIVLKEPKGVFNLLPAIMLAADGGSVIARDHAVGILIKLATLKRYAASCLPFLIEQLTKCPGNQFPMYIEHSSQLITPGNKALFQKVIRERIEGLEKESQRLRVLKISKRIDNKIG